MNLRTAFTLGLLSLVCAAPAAGDFTSGSVYYVSPSIGNDNWSGLETSSTAEGKGPFASIQRAIGAIRQETSRRTGTTVTIVLSGETHELSSTLSITPDDTADARASVVFMSAPGERASISGGRAIHKWKELPNGWWEASLAENGLSTATVQQLFVNGERRSRPRMPREGFYSISHNVPSTSETHGKGHDRMGFAGTDIRADWANLHDVEVLAFQVWTMTRLRIAEVDVPTSSVTFSGPTRWSAAFGALSAGKRYIVENVKEALGTPGDYYFDKSAGTVSYVPKAGEKIGSTEIVACVVDPILFLKGEPEKKRFVQNVIFQDINFVYGGYVTPAVGQMAHQANVEVRGAIDAVGARSCRWERCSVAHVGTWGIRLGNGCSRNRIIDCVMEDLGGGGVRVGQISEEGEAESRNNDVINCLFRSGGRIHPAATGVLVGNSSHNRIERNTIQDFYYTGISVGWSWGYGASAAHHNLIVGNRIFDIGQGVLSDMGGIYTLGQAPGTKLERNWIENVRSFDYGGWGIYFDEGTSGVLARDNIVSGTKTGAFHQHYGGMNTLVNNIFAYGGPYNLARTRAEEHLSLTMRKNVNVWGSNAVLNQNWAGNNYVFDDNLYWGSSPTLTFGGLTMEQWRAKGQDVHSMIADPLFVDAPHGNFRFRPGSPAERLGIKDIDTSTIGCTLGEPEKTYPAAFPLR